MGLLSEIRKKLGVAGHVAKEVVDQTAGSAYRYAKGIAADLPAVIGTQRHVQNIQSEIDANNTYSNQRIQAKLSSASPQMRPRLQAMQNAPGIDAYQETYGNKDLIYNPQRFKQDAFNTASLVAPAAKVPMAGRLASTPLRRFATASVVRGLEGGAYQAGSNVIQHRPVFENTGKTALIAAGTNAVLSPRVTAAAGKQIYNTGRVIDSVTGTSSRRGFARLPQNIPSHDKEYMAQFIDDVRLGTKKLTQQDYDYAYELAKDRGLITKPSDLNKGLDNVFEEALHDNVVSGVIPKRNEAGNRYAGSETYRNYVPGQSRELAMGKRKGFANPFAKLDPEAPAEKISKAFTSGERKLTDQGAAGAALTQKLKGQRVEQEMLKGKYEVQLQDAAQGLQKNDINDMKAILNGNQVNNPRAQAAAQQVRRLLDDVAGQAEKTGLEIKLPNGDSVPFKRQENYFPRRYDFTPLKKQENRNKVLQHLVDTGQAQNIANADHILTDYIQGNTVRKAGNLEAARVLDLPLPEKPPLQALQEYVDSATRRLTEAQNFGLKDEVAKDLIDKIRQEGGDYKYAQEVYDLMVGNKRYENVGVDLANKFNVITKLNLSFITNATQPVNTATKFGVIRTLNAILKAYGQPEKSGKFARGAGAIDDQLIKSEAGVSMGRIIEDVLSPFSYVERKNRTSAAIAAQDFVESVSKKLINNPKNALAIRQLKSLGLEPEKIIAQGGITPEDILKGAKVGADVTQFKTDAIDVPPGWKTNIGRLLTQFKSFSFKQTQFVRDEVIKEAAQGNIQPMLRLIALAVPASFISTSVRNKLTGRDPKSAEKSLDVRKLDYYLKAFGTIPTDIATQAEFLKSTYNNKYATDLQKIGRTVGSFLGPTASEGFDVVNAFEQASKIKEENKDLPKGKQPNDPYLTAKRELVEKIPFVGQYAKNKYFAFPTDNKSDFSRLITALKNNDQAAVDKALSTYSDRSRKATLKRALDIVIEEKQKNGEDTQSYYKQSAQDSSAKAADTSPTKYTKADITREEVNLEKSNENFREVGGYVFRKDSEGKVTSMPKIEYDLKVSDNKLQKAKTTKNIKGWTEEANKKLELLKKQYADPTLDELERSDIEEKASKLIADMQKYKGYGGFTKPKKGKKPKKPHVTVVKQPHITAKPQAATTRPAFARKTSRAALRAASPIKPRLTAAISRGY